MQLTNVTWLMMRAMFADGRNAYQQFESENLAASLRDGSLALLMNNLCNLSHFILLIFPIPIRTPHRLSSPSKFFLFCHLLILFSFPSPLHFPPIPLQEGLGCNSQ